MKTDLPSNLIKLSRLAEQDFLSSGVSLEAQAEDVVTLPGQTSSQAKQPAKSIFASTFLTIFLAELGDKTQLSTLLMSAESQSPWVVFMGSAAALVTTSLVGVLLGRILANRLSPRTMERLAGVSLLLISAMLLWEVVQS